MATTQHEHLCCRCSRRPVVYPVRPHPGVGLCAPCYIGLISSSAAQVPELAAAG